METMKRCSPEERVVVVSKYVDQLQDPVQSLCHFLTPKVKEETISQELTGRSAFLCACRCTRVGDEIHGSGWLTEQSKVVVRMVLYHSSNRDGGEGSAGGDFV